MTALALRTALPAPEVTARPRASLQRCGGTTCPAGTCGHDDDKPLARYAVGPGPRRAPGIVGEVLATPGRPLAPQVRSTMEARFGHDFSRVRIHADDAAASSARAVHALAYTVGSHVAFGAGRYAPETSDGQRLLAHELTHVVQQRGVGPSTGAAELAVAEDDRAETDAAMVADALDPMMAGPDSPEEQGGDGTKDSLRGAPNRMAVSPARHRIHFAKQRDGILQRQPAGPLGIEAPPGECPTRCGGIPSNCVQPFCCPFPLGTATLIRDAIRDPFLVAIGIKVPLSVVPVWAIWFNGGSSLQNFTTDFGSDFAADTVTVRVAGLLAAQLASEIDVTALQPLASAAGSGTSVSLLPALPPDYLLTRSRSLEDEANRNALLMDFDVIGSVAGNIAGGVGKTQTTCRVGARPSPVNDARLLSNVFATLVRNPNGSVTVTPSFRFHVIDTVDLCPGNCGSGLGFINEQQATIPMSRLEASGVSGDVPFTVDFTTAPQPAFTIAPPSPPAPVDVTVSGSTLFDFGSDQLRAGGEAALIAQLGDRPLHADLSQPFLIEGHTDSRGTDAVNQPLSELRARRVAEILEHHYPNLVGHTATVGFGASRPVALNTIGGADNPAGRALNRRVEIHFSAPPVP